MAAIPSAQLASEKICCRKALRAAPEVDAHAAQEPDGAALRVGSDGMPSRGGGGRKSSNTSMPDVEAPVAEDY
jgi:hypothetical protein